MNSTLFARSICVALLRLRLRDIPLTRHEGGKNGNFNREGYIGWRRDAIGVLSTLSEDSFLASFADRSVSHKTKPSGHVPTQSETHSTDLPPCE
jgi:hypothetical protein